MKLNQSSNKLTRNSLCLVNTNTS